MLHSCCSCFFTWGVKKRKVLKKLILPAADYLLMSSNQLNTNIGLRRLNVQIKNRDNMANVTRKERFLIVGLGNFIYPDTRHSVGMMAADCLLARLGGRWEDRRDLTKLYGGPFGRSIVSAESQDMIAELFVFKPKTLMNINGKNVLKAAKQLDIQADKIYLLHDELDKAVGKAGIKHGGSARGHKGVLSCYEYLRNSHLWPKISDDDFKGMPRIQIGIGRPTTKSQIVPYVLGRFPAEDIDGINLAIEKGLDVLLRHISSKMTMPPSQEDLNDNGNS